MASKQNERYAEILEYLDHGFELEVGTVYRVPDNAGGWLPRSLWIPRGWTEPWKDLVAICALQMRTAPESPWRNVGQFSPRVLQASGEAGDTQVTRLLTKVLSDPDVLAPLMCEDCIVDAIEAYAVALAKARIVLGMHPLNLFIPPKGEFRLMLVQPSDHETEIAPPKGLRAALGVLEKRSCGTICIPSVSTRKARTE